MARTLLKFFVFSLNLGFVGEVQRGHGGMPLSGRGGGWIQRKEKPSISGPSRPSPRLLGEGRPVLTLQRTPEPLRPSLRCGGKGWDGRKVPVPPLQQGLARRARCFPNTMLSSNMGNMWDPPMMPREVSTPKKDGEKDPDPRPGEGVTGRGRVERLLGSLPFFSKRSEFTRKMYMFPKWVGGKQSAAT